MVEAGKIKAGDRLWVPTTYGPLEVEIVAVTWVAWMETRTKLFVRTTGNDWIGEDRLYLSREEADVPARQLAREHAEMLRRHISRDEAEVVRLDAYADGR